MDEWLRWTLAGLMIAIPTIGPFVVHRLGIINGTQLTRYFEMLSSGGISVIRKPNQN